MESRNDPMNPEEHIQLLQEDVGRYAASLEKAWKKIETLTKRNHALKEELKAKTKNREDPQPLIEHMNRLGMDANQVAERAGMVVVNVKGYLKGIIPRVDKAIAVARAVGVRPDEILWGKPTDRKE